MLVTQHNYTALPYTIITVVEWSIQQYLAYNHFKNLFHISYIYHPGLTSINGGASGPTHLKTIAVFLWL